MKNHVVNLDLSKKLNTLLKEKGMKVPESMFYWVNDGTPELHDWTVVKDTWTSKTEKIPAYLSSEVGEMLPIGFATWKNVKGDDWWCGDFKHTLSPMDGDTECNARAEMLCFLLQEGLIK
jgi:hypothetical protein